MTTKLADDRVIMTRQGYDKLKAELIELRGEGRAKIAASLEEARGFGDLSENAEYHAAKDEQGKLETRILMLEYQLSKAQIVDTQNIDISTANIGTTVTLKDLDNKKTYTYTLVGTEEADIKENRISASSPVGKAVYGQKNGSEVVARTPRGVRHLKIMKISLL